MKNGSCLIIKHEIETFCVGICLKTEDCEGWVILYSDKYGEFIKYFDIVAGSMIQGDESNTLLH